MPKATPKKKPVDKDNPLNSGVENADPVQAHIISEYKKEIARLQKLLAQTTVQKDSEIERLKAELSEAKKESHLIIKRVIVSPDKT